jgi:uncharacterized membrane protein YhaH (DUF805 family)
MTDPTPIPPQLATRPAAGWYPDVEVPGGQRWWDGTSWTEHRQPPPTASQPYGPSTTVQPYVAAPQFTGSEPPLWAPWYGIPFAAAVRRGWKKYADFDGRASLTEYWWWALFSGLVGLGGYVLLLVSIGVTAMTGGVGAVLLVLVAVAYVGATIALIVPSIAVGVRRLHDANYPGPMYLLVFVPFGSIIVLVFMLMPSNPAGARFDRG